MHFIKVTQLLQNQKVRHKFYFLKSYILQDFFDEVLIEYLKPQRICLKQIISNLKIHGDLHLHFLTYLSLLQKIVTKINTFKLTPKSENPKTHANV